MLRLAFLAALFTCSFTSWGMRVFIDHQTFYSPEGGPYLEIVFSFDGKTLFPNKIEAEDINYQGSANILLTLSQNDSIVRALKFKAASGYSHTTTIADFMCVERIPIPDGKYDLYLEITDAYSPIVKPLTHAESIEINHLDEGCFFSDIAFVSALTPTEQINPFSKGGYDLIPYVSNYFPNSLDALIFYSELYNAKKLLGKKVAFAYTVSITDNLQHEIPGSKRIIRSEADEVIPIIYTLDISKLTTGDYKLKLEMLDRAGQVVCTKFRDFSRNKTVENTFQAPQAQDLSNTFVSHYTNSDSLLAHIQSCLPIAESVERNTIDNILPTVDLGTRQSFFYTFWVRRNPENPQAAWDNYYKDVLAVQRDFGTKIKKGWQTDRGRVYLQYGKPNTRVVRNNSPDYWPFEIWHYYNTNTGLKDRRFLFYNTSLSSDFELLHSDVPNEIQNYDWKNMVRSRQMNDPNTVGRLKNNQRVNPFSGDELEDLWYNPN